MRARPWLTGATLIALAILVGLGTWQLQRLAWKDQLLERIAQSRSLPAMPVMVLIDTHRDTGEIEFRRAYADCIGLATARVVQLYSVVGGQPGWRLISACPVESGRYDAVLVDRGFMSMEMQAPASSGSAGTDVVRATGPLRGAQTAGPFTPPPGNDRWYSRDIGGMASALGVERPAPVILTAERPIPPNHGLIAAPLPDEIANRHLEYALTWFGLAGALAVIYAVMLFRPRAAA